MTKEEIDYIKATLEFALEKGEFTDAEIEHLYSATCNSINLLEQFSLTAVMQVKPEKFCGCDWWGDGKSEIHLNTYYVCKHCDEKL